MTVIITYQDPDDPFLMGMASDSKVCSGTTLLSETDAKIFSFMTDSSEFAIGCCGTTFGFNLIWSDLVEKVKGHKRLQDPKRNPALDAWEVGRVLKELMEDYKMTPRREEHGAPCYGERFLLMRLQRKDLVGPITLQARDWCNIWELDESLSPTYLVPGRACAIGSGSQFAIGAAYGVSKTWKCQRKPSNAKARLEWILKTGVLAACASDLYCGGRVVLCIPDGRPKETTHAKK